METLANTRNQTVVEIKDSPDYNWFRSTVPLKRIIVDDDDSKVWSLYDAGPKSIRCPIMFLPPVSGTAEVFFQQMLALTGWGYRVIALQYPVYWDLMEFCDGFRKLLDHLQLDKRAAVDGGLAGAPRPAKDRSPGIREAVGRWRRSCGGRSVATELRRSAGGDGAAAVGRWRRSCGGRPVATERRRSAGGDGAAAVGRWRQSGSMAIGVPVVPAASFRPSLSPHSLNLVQASELYSQPSGSSVRCFLGWLPGPEVCGIHMQVPQGALFDTV
ncbi:maspardin isoform X2 [Vanacampus margaritifer]